VAFRVQFFRLIKTLVDFAASLKTGVWILAAFMVVVFFGTLYQVDHGLHAAQDLFYYAWFTPPISQWPAPDAVSVWARIAAWFPVPLPGGWLVMWALFINLSLSMMRRARYAWRKAGIILAHAGVLLMLAGGWIAHLTAQEGFLSLAEGDRSSFALAYEDWELAIWDDTTLPEEAPYTFSANALTAGKELALEELGLVFTVEAYYPNARPHQESPAPGEEPVLNVTGITRLEPDLRRGDPGRYEPGLQARAQVAGHDPQRVIFHASDPMPLVLSLPDAQWYLHLRRRPMPLPVTVQLLAFRKVFEPHTTTPRSFSSRVLVDTDGVQRELVIEMNRPFRYGGFTFFQSSYGETEDGRDISIFAISHNRVMWAPYIATGMTGLGMLIQFLIQWIKPRRKKGGTVS